MPDITFRTTCSSACLPIKLVVNHPRQWRSCMKGQRNSCRWKTCKTSEPTPKNPSHRSLQRRAHRSQATCHRPERQPSVRAHSSLATPRLLSPKPRSCKKRSTLIPFLSQGRNHHLQMSMGARISYITATSTTQRKNVTLFVTR